ncbi:hypothetical protein IG631_04066 [Alternaria alternata]|nr:hypothetical protein IG631_04066 [Alternaria alternata]
MIPQTISWGVVPVQSLKRPSTAYKDAPEAASTFLRVSRFFGLRCLLTGQRNFASGFPRSVRLVLSRAVLAVELHCERLIA